MFKKLLTYSILSLVGMMGFFGRYDNHITVGENPIVFAEALKNPDGSIIKDTSGYMGEPAKPATPDAEMQKMLNSLVGGLNIMLDVLTIIVSPAIMLASWLMSPDWTSGDLFGIRPALHSLWVTVSNVVYFVYAILLIFIALATIFNSQNYGYKQLLPKLALGVILVPLTWWFVQFTISLSTYITASVISIPMETLAKYSQPGSFWNTESIPKKIIYENSKVLNEDSKEIDKNTVLCKDKGKCVSPETFIKTSGGMYSPLLVYSFSVFKFHEVKKLKKESDAVYAIGDIIHQGIIGVIMFIVYGLLVLALIFMLLMRAVKLWFYAIFSPLFTIKYVLGDKGFGDADKDGSFKITEFIGLAFVPAVVSLALSFGLIIISVMHAGGTNSGSASSNSECKGEKCTLTIMGTNSIVSTTTGEGTNKKSVTTVNIGGDKDENRISYEFKGSVQGGEPILGSVTSALGSTGNLFGTIILDIIALIFIWIAFMAGKGVSKAAGKAIEPFEQMGNKIGSLGASLPKYAPLPLPGGSVAGMGKLTEKVSEIPVAAADKRAKESQLGRMLGMGDQTDTVAMRKIDDRLASNLKEAVQQGGTLAKENMQLAMQNGAKDNVAYIKTHKDLMDAYKKEYVDEHRIASAMKDNGMDEELAKKMAVEIAAGRTDLRSNDKLLKYWKEAATKPGSGTSGVSGNGYTVADVAVASGKEKRQQFTIEGAKLNIDVTGKNLTISPEDLEKIRVQMKNMTQEEFEKKLPAINDEVKGAILAKLEIKHFKSK